MRAPSAEVPKSLKSTLNKVQFIKAITFILCFSLCFSHAKKKEKH